MVAERPVAVAVEGDQHVFQMYKSGVFDVSNDECGTRSTMRCSSSATGPMAASTTGRSRTAAGRRGAKPATAFTLHLTLTAHPPLPPPPSTLQLHPPPPPGYFPLLHQERVRRPPPSPPIPPPPARRRGARHTTTAPPASPPTTTPPPPWWMRSPVPPTPRPASSSRASGAPPQNRARRRAAAPRRAIRSTSANARRSRKESASARSTPVRGRGLTSSNRAAPSSLPLTTHHASRHTDCKGCATPRLSVFEDGNRSGCVWVLNGTLTRDLSLTWPNGTTTTYTNLWSLRRRPPPTTPLTAHCRRCRLYRRRATATRRSRPTGRVPRARRWIVGAWFYDHKASTDLLPWLPDLPAALNASSATLRVTLRRRRLVLGAPLAAWVLGRRPRVRGRHHAHSAASAARPAAAACARPKRGQPLSPLRRRPPRDPANFEGGGDSLLARAAHARSPRDPRDDPAARVPAR